MKCPKCLKNKKPEQFNNSHTWCLDCRRKYIKQWRAKNKQKIKSYTEKHKEYYKKWYAENSRNRDPIKQAAHYIVKKAIKAGILKRPNECSNCSTTSTWTNIEAHHPDYSKPLEVIWLCNRCHRKLHPGNRTN